MRYLKGPLAEEQEYWESHRLLLHSTLIIKRPHKCRCNNSTSLTKTFSPTIESYPTTKSTTNIYIFSRLQGFYQIELHPKLQSALGKGQQRKLYTISLEGIWKSSTIHNFGPAGSFIQVKSGKESSERVDKDPSKDQGKSPSGCWDTTIFIQEEQQQEFPEKYCYSVLAITQQLSGVRSSAFEGSLTRCNKSFANISSAVDSSVGNRFWFWKTRKKQDQNCIVFEHLWEQSTRKEAYKLSKWCRIHHWTLLCYFWHPPRGTPGQILFLKLFLKLPSQSNYSSWENEFQQQQHYSIQEDQSKQEEWK